MKPDSALYIVSFLITALVFATAVATSSFINDRRLSQLQGIEDRISIDILSLETQFDLFENISCKDIEKNPILSSELNKLAQRVDYTEKELGTKDERVVDLKRQYSLLLIKDYVLTQRIEEKCNIKPVVALYFYSNAGDCSECEKTGYVLDYLRETYPELRVYAFDYNLDLPALRTLINIVGVKPTLPALVIQDTPYYGFMDKDTLITTVPALKQLEKLRVASSTQATTTKKR